MVKGAEWGLASMRVGEEAILWVSAELGFGDEEEEGVPAGSVHVARCCAFGRGWVLLRALLDSCLGARAVRALSPLYGLYGLVLDIAGPAVSRRSA